MPIIIWGERGLTSQLDSGRFYCPQCDSERPYLLKQVRPWFTLYWIPIFPMGGAQRFVECQKCGGTFVEDVLEMEAPSEGQRMMARLFRDLEKGASVEEVERRLRDEEGLDREQAHKVAEQLGGDDAWACQTCGQHYLREVRQCRRCKG
jgi:hypothetical protein